MRSSNELTPLNTAIDIDDSQACITTVYFPEGENYRGLDIPEDIFRVIFTFLSYRDLLNVGQISKALYHFIEKYHEEIRKDMRWFHGSERETSAFQLMARNPEFLNNSCYGGYAGIALISGLIGFLLGTFISLGIERSKGPYHEIDGPNILLWGGVGALAAPLGGAAAAGYRRLSLYYRDQYQTDIDHENNIRDRYNPC